MNIVSSFECGICLAGAVKYFEIIVAMCVCSIDIWIGSVLTPCIVFSLQAQAAGRGAAPGRGIVPPVRR